MSDTGIDPKLLEILVCPATKGPLKYDKKNQGVADWFTKIQASLMK